MFIFNILLVTIEKLCTNIIVILMFRFLNDNRVSVLNEWLQIGAFIEDGGTAATLLIKSCILLREGDLFVEFFIKLLPCKGL